MVARQAPRTDDNGYTVVGNGHAADMGNGEPTERTGLLSTTIDVHDDPAFRFRCGASITTNARLVMMRFSWALGVTLATISGFIFTANNLLIQYYEIGALEILLVRSALQVNLVGIVAGVAGTRMLPGSFFNLLCVSGQAVISTAVIYLSYRSVLIMKKQFQHFVYQRFVQKKTDILNY